MDEQLKGLMQELGNAINKSLSDSDRIAAAIGEIKRAGYDVFLVLEATIGFNKREDGGSVPEADGIITEQHAGKGVYFRFNSEDEKFLRAIKITPYGSK